jgi:hypothetical protein
MVGRQWVRLGHSAMSPQCPVCAKADMSGRFAHGPGHDGPRPGPPRLPATLGGRSIFPKERAGAAEGAFRAEPRRAKAAGIIDPTRTPIY